VFRILILITEDAIQTQRRGYLFLMTSTNYTAVVINTAHAGRARALSQTAKIFYIYEFLNCKIIRHPFDVLHLRTLPYHTPVPKLF
ncbi:hypothetical protein THOM_2762, partial [Trachipleistophora hominis]